MVGASVDKGRIPHTNHHAPSGLRDWFLGKVFYEVHALQPAWPSHAALTFWFSLSGDCKGLVGNCQHATHMLPIKFWVAW